MRSRLNLFLSTRRLTSSREDHLSEFFAAALESDHEFREAYTRLLLESYAGERGWDEPRIVNIETQVDYPLCIPDLRLILNDGHRILVEHKIDAPETMLITEDEELGQLQRYLSLDVDGVAYVRSSWKAPSPDILEHSRYIKPAKSIHFLWRDFYEALSLGKHELSRWLTEGFEVMGYVPPHPEVGDLNDPDLEVRTQNRQNFAKYWGPVIDFAASKGWRSEVGSIAELYLTSDIAKNASAIFISPVRVDSFIVRATPRADVQSLCSKLISVVQKIEVSAETKIAEIRRSRGIIEVVEIVSTQRAILKNASRAEDIDAALLAFVEPLLEALEED